MNNLPNLSEWFEVPAGATIPKGTRYVLLWGDGSISVASYGGPSLVTEAGRYYTAEPIEAPKPTLEDVIREAGSSVSDIAKAVEAFYAEQPKQPRVIIDAEGDEWRLNVAGKYDLWDYDLQGFTRERIEALFGIKEERD